MFLLGFTLGLIISILCFVVYLVIENSMLKRDLLDAVEELGVRQQEPMEKRKLIGFITPVKKQKSKQNK